MIKFYHNIDIVTKLSLVYLHLQLLQSNYMSKTHQPTDDQDLENDIFISKCQGIGRKKGFDFSILLSSISSHQLLRMIKKYFKDLKHFGQTTADNELLTVIVHMFQEKFGKLEDQVQKSLTVLASKVSEKQLDQQINSQYKNAICKFFMVQMPRKLNEFGIEQTKQARIINLLLKYQFIRYRSQIINFRKAYGLNRYRDQMQELNQCFLKIRQQFYDRIKELPILMTLKKRQFTNLQVIKIVYERNSFLERRIGRLENDKCKYSISALLLFRVIYKNRFLIEATVKGINVQMFEPFIKILNPERNSLFMQQKRQQDWIKNFSPSRSLKLTINIQIRFFLQDEQETLSQIADLNYLSTLFFSLSQIQVFIFVEQWRNVNYWAMTLQILLKSLRKIKKIKINVIAKNNFQNRNQITSVSAPFVRSVLFGGLALLTEITHLSFYEIGFSPLIINDLLAIECIIKKIFQNNRIIHSKLQCCHFFPFSTEVSTLQQVSIFCSQFKANNEGIGFINKLFNKCRSIRSLKCQNYDEPWTIDQNIFNQLESLVISSFSMFLSNLDGNPIIKDILPKTPSKIQNLRIYSKISFMGTSLSIMFSKLANLSYLNIDSISFSTQLLLCIPSPHLQELMISSNSALTSKGMRKIDKKWPYLKYLYLSGCRGIDKQAFKDCLFKGLIEFNVDITLDEQEVQKLKKRGIKVHQNKRYCCSSSDQDSN